MKKIIIVAIVIVLAAAAAVLLTVNKNNEASAETVVMSLDDFDFSDDYLTQEEADAAAMADLQNRIAENLSQFEWVSSAKVTIAADNLSATAFLDISREPLPEEADAAAQIITFYVDGLQKEDVVITDQNSNVIYSE